MLTKYCILESLLELKIKLLNLISGNNYPILSLTLEVVNYIKKRLFKDKILITNLHH